MGLPRISVIFKNVATTAIQRSQRGIVALILEDTDTVKGIYSMDSVTDIPAGLSDENKKQINLAFVGGSNAPYRVVAVVQTTSATPNYTDSLTALESIKFDYLAVPKTSAGNAGTISSWIKTQRDTNGRGVKAVLPKLPADHEGIINFTTDTIKTIDGQTYMAADYCSRIAGLLSGNPLTMSATYQVLPEVVDVPHLTVSQADTKVDAGELFLYFDGTKVKVARAVNSLQTIVAPKSQSWKKIKIIDTMDMIRADIKTTAEDSYIGKVVNDYDHKCLLVSAINGYLNELKMDDVIDVSSSAFIDVQAQKVYLQSVGVSVETMNDDQIKNYPTDDKVFLSANIKMLDTMEDITLTCIM